MPVQLRRGRAFVWLVECGALGIFQWKGSFLEADAKEWSRGWDHGCWCPLLFFYFLSLSLTVHLSGTLFPVSRSLYLSVDLSLLDNPISLLCLCLLCSSHQPLCSIVYSQSSPRLHLPDSAVGLCDVDCTGLGPSMIRAGGSRCYRETERLRAAASASDSGLGGSCSTAW